MAEHGVNAGMSAEDADGLAHMLEPVLRDHCGGRLGPIEWFRSQWQRGGAATGFSLWSFENGGCVPVLVKLPVGPVEYRWTSRLGKVDDASWAEGAGLPVPRVVACGTEVGGYDLAWVVVERLSGSPLGRNGSHLVEQDVRDMLEAVVEFQSRAVAAHPVDAKAARSVKEPDWEALIERGREGARDHVIANAPRWSEALRQVGRALPGLLKTWHARPINAWCHGDVHPGNAMRRTKESGSPTLPGGENGFAIGGGAPLGSTVAEREGELAGEGGCVLIDMALVHPGHWLEDALYLERQFWGHEQYLHGIKPVSELARLRRERGMSGGGSGGGAAEDGDYAHLACVRRVLAAACAPALIEREGNPKYIHAALEVVEKFLPMAAR